LSEPHTPALSQPISDNKYSHAFGPPPSRCSALTTRPRSHRSVHAGHCRLTHQPRPQTVRMLQIMDRFMQQAPVTQRAQDRGSTPLALHRPYICVSACATLPFRTRAVIARLCSTRTLPTPPLSGSVPNAAPHTPSRRRRRLRGAFTLDRPLVTCRCTCACHRRSSHTAAMLYSSSTSLESSAASSYSSDVMAITSSPSASSNSPSAESYA
jgi:hypothetical protein